MAESKRALRAPIIIVVLMFLHASAFADVCRSSFGGTMSEAAAKERVAELSAELSRNRQNMKTWHITWFAVYGSAAAAQAGLAIVADDDDQQAIFGVSAVRSTIAMAAVPVLGIRSYDLTLSGDTCADLEATEFAVKENARLHRKGRAWIKHAGVVALNSAAFLYLGLRHDLWARGAIGGALGLVVGELQIYTQPMRAVELNASLSTPGGARRQSLRWLPMLGNDRVGISLGGLL